MNDTAGAFSGVEPQFLLGGLADGVIAAGEDGVIVYANPAVEMVTGWPPASLIGQPLTTIIPEDLRDSHRRGFARFIESGIPRLIGTAVNVPALTPQGTTRPIELTLNAIPTASGRIFVAALRDLTDRQEADRQRNLASYLRAVADLAVALGLSGDARTLDEAAPVVLRMLGEALAWEVGDVWLVQSSGTVACEAAWWLKEEFREFADTSLGLEFDIGHGLPGRVVASGTPEWISDVTVDDNFPRAAQAGELGLHSAFGFPIAGGGRIIGVISFFTSDVRPPDNDLLAVMEVVGRALGEFVVRERAEAASRFRSALLAAEAEAIIDGIVVVGLDGTLLSWNKRFETMTGLEPEDLRDNGLQALLQRADSLMTEGDALVELAIAVGSNPDAEMRREFTFRDGRVIDLHTAPLRDDGHNYGRGFYLRDITEQRLNQRRLATIATTLQASLLPPTAPELPGLDVAARYSPAETGMEIGGDFYDVFPFTGATWGFAIGDVCGRGAEAASLTALARYTLRAVALRARRPSRMLRSLNETVLANDLDNRFLTVIAGRARVHSDRADITFACGGHPLPLVVRADGSTEWVGRPGTLIGVFDSVSLSDATVVLSVGDSLVLFTDGVTEARSPSGTMLGTEGLQRALEGAAGQSADEIADHVMAAVASVTQGESSDDVAVLVVRMPA